MVATGISRNIAPSKSANLRNWVARQVVRYFFGEGYIRILTGIFTSSGVLFLILEKFGFAVAQSLHAVVAFGVGLLLLSWLSGYAAERSGLLQQEAARKMELNYGFDKMFKILEQIHGAVKR